jgi:hypothetical protein
VVFLRSRLASCDRRSDGGRAEDREPRRLLRHALADERGHAANASRVGDRIVVHVVNTHRTATRTCAIAVEGQTVRAGKAFEIAADPWVEVGTAPVR